MNEPFPYRPLLLSEERMRFALLSAGIGIWGLDPVNNRVEWDERCKELYGFPPDNVVTYEQVLQYTHPLTQQQYPHTS